MRLPACFLVAAVAAACQPAAYEMTDAQRAEVEASALEASRAWTMVHQINSRIAREREQALGHSSLRGCHYR